MCLAGLKTEMQSGKKMFLSLPKHLSSSFWHLSVTHEVAILVVRNRWLFSGSRARGAGVYEEQGCLSLQKCIISCSSGSSITYWVFLLLEASSTAIN